MSETKVVLEDSVVIADAVIDVHTPGMPTPVRVDPVTMDLVEKRVKTVLADKNDTEPTLEESPPKIDQEDGSVS